MSSSPVDDSCCAACGQTLPPASGAATPIRGGRIRIEVAHADTTWTVEPTTPTVVVGRTSPADLVLADSVISRRQCELVITDERVIVRDLQSACGTWVDRMRVVGDTEVFDGSQLAMGNYTLTIRRA